MPNFILTGGILFLITGVLHIVKFDPIGIRKNDNPVLIFGYIYLVLGIIVLNFETWVYWPALIFTLIGMIGALATYKKSLLPPILKIVFVLIDLALVIIFIRALILRPISLPQLVG